MSKKEEIAVVDKALLDQLTASYPVEPGFNRLLLPRLTFKSQDVMEGKGKNKKVVIEAGTFFTERSTDQKDGQGKVIWEKEEIGQELEGFIAYQRKQLRYYDEPSDAYYSTPIYDTNEDVIPLFKGGKKIGSGTPAELKKSFEYTNEEGKQRSKLEDNVILYVLVDGELFQMGLRGSSMYSFKGFSRSVAVPTQLIHFSSTPQVKGSNEWNQMEFKAVRTVTNDEAMAILEAQDQIKDAIAAEKAAYAEMAQDDTVTAAVIDETAALPAGKDEDF